MTDRTESRPVHRYLPLPTRHCGHRFDDGIVCAAQPESPIHNVAAAMDAAVGPQVRDASGWHCECFPVTNESGLGPKPGEQTKATLNPLCPIHGDKQQPHSQAVDVTQFGAIGDKPVARHSLFQDWLDYHEEWIENNDMDSLGRHVVAMGKEMEAQAAQIAAYERLDEEGYASLAEDLSIAEQRIASLENWAKQNAALQKALDLAHKAIEACIAVEQNPTSLRREKEAGNAVMEARKARAPFLKGREKDR